MSRVQLIEQREQRLRDTVTSRRACLGDLPRRERRVLVLRAGVGPGPPLSRAHVARRLDISLRRVARLERAGLRRLRTLCGGAALVGSATVTGRLVSEHPGAAAGAPATPGAVPSGGAAGNASAGGGGASRGGSGGHDDGGSGSGSPEASSGEVAGISATHPPGSGTINLTIPLILLALAVTTWGLVRTLRRGGGTPATAEAPPAPARPRWHTLPPSTMEGPGWAERPPSGTDDAAEPGWTAPPRSRNVSRR